MISIKSRIGPSGVCKRKYIDSALGSASEHRVFSIFIPNLIKRSVELLLFFLQSGIFRCIVEDRKLHRSVRLDELSGADAEQADRRAVPQGVEQAARKTVERFTRLRRRGELHLMGDARESIILDFHADGGGK